MPREAKNTTLIIVLASIPMLAFIPQWNKPFDDHLRGACGSFFTLMARHHVELGFHVTAGVSAINPGPTSKEDLVYYRHHPPGIPILVALSFLAFGESESSARLVPTLFLWLTLIALGCLSLRLLGRIGLLSTIICCSLIPLVSYYGLFTNFEIPCLALWVISYACFHGWQRSGRSAFWLGSLLAFAAGGLLDWVVFLGAPILSLFAWRSVHARRRTIAVSYFAVALFVVGFVALWAELQARRFGLFPEDASSYLHSVSPLAPNLDLLFWAKEQVRFLWIFGSFALPFSVIGTAIAIYRRSPSRGPMLAFASVGILNVFLLAARSLTHDYYVLYFLPWLALGVSEFVTALWNLRPRVIRFLARGAVVAAALSCAWSSYSIVKERGHQTTLAELGREIGAILQEDEAAFIDIGKPDIQIQIPAYARRPIFSATAPLDVSLGFIRTYNLSGRKWSLLLRHKEDLDHMSHLKPYVFEPGMKRGEFWAYRLGIQ